MGQFKNVDSSIGRPKNLLVGQLIKINVTNGGTGYTNGASVAVTIGAPAGGGEQAVATALVSGGIVKSITLSNPGSNYTSNPTVTMAGGASLAVEVVRAPVDIPLSEIVYVDATEANQASNRAKGMKHSGWYRLKTKVDQDGSTRYFAELLAASTNTQVGAGDASDDLVVPDLSATASISVQPTNQTAVGGNATFTITAAIAPSGTTLYQWQLQAVGSNKWANVAAANAASLALAGLVAGDNGKKYRCVITGGGAKAIYSNVATLTV